MKNSESDRARDLFVSGRSIDEVCKELQISRTSFYRYRKRWKIPSIRIGILDYFRRSADYYNRLPQGEDWGFLELRVASLLAKELDCKISFDPVSFHQLFTGVRTGSFELAMGFIGNSLARRQKFSMSEPYVTSINRATGVLVARKELRVTIEDLTKDVKLRIGTLASSQSHDWLLNRGVSAEKIMPLAYPSGLHGALQSKNVDVLIEAYFTLKTLVENNPEFEFKSSLIYYEKIGVCFLMNKEDDELQNRVNDGILRLRKKFLLEPIEEKIFLMENLPPEDHLQEDLNNR